MKLQATSAARLSALSVASLALCTLVLSGCASSAGQQSNSSTVAADKQSMTDQAIQTDYDNYAAEQEIGRAHV